MKKVQLAICAVETHSVLCDVGTENLYIIWIIVEQPLIEQRQLKSSEPRAVPKKILESSVYFSLEILFIIFGLRDYNYPQVIIIASITSIKISIVTNDNAIVMAYIIFAEWKKVNKQPIPCLHS